MRRKAFAASPFLRACPVGPKDRTGVPASFNSAWCLAPTNAVWALPTLYMFYPAPTRSFSANRGGSPALMMAEATFSTS